MKSPFGFIIEPDSGKLYSTERKSSKLGVIESNSIDEGRATNRFGIVVETPTWYTGPILKGDRVIVHHNTFRKYNDYDGNERYSSFFAGDGRYLVELSQMYAYFRDGVFITIGDNILVKPLEEKLHGVVYFSNESNDIDVGQEIRFTPESEYSFYIDGVEYYKMTTGDVCMMEVK